MPVVERLVVVSHACVVPSNQGVFAALEARGRAVDLVLPRRWRNEYGDVAARDGPELHGVSRVAVVGRGRPQRHVYLTSATAQLRRRRAQLAIVEEEPFSLAAWQWCRAAARSGIPYGVQVAETLDRPMPWVVARVRTRILAGASVVLARSPSAAALATRWGARGSVAVLPHSTAVVPARPTPDGVPTIAFIGRLVEAKGLVDLLDAVALLAGGVRLLVAGDGPLRARVQAQRPSVEFLGPIAHDRVDEVYRRAHVTCVPSRTTPTWEEQFGRVAIESLVRGVPVVASASGALPWVLESTGGGVLVAERQPRALADALSRVLDDRVAGEALGASGRAGVLRTFTDEVVAGQLDALLTRISGR